MVVVVVGRRCGTIDGILTASVTHHHGGGGTGRRRHPPTTTANRICQTPHVAGCRSRVGIGHAGVPARHRRGGNTRPADHTGAHNAAKTPHTRAHGRSSPTATVCTTGCGRRFRLGRTQGLIRAAAAAASAIMRRRSTRTLRSLCALNARGIGKETTAICAASGSRGCFHRGRRIVMRGATRRPWNASDLANRRRGAQ